MVKIPLQAQDAIAALILEKLEDEQRWAAAFEASQDELTKVAEKVRGDIRADRTQKTGFGEL